MSYGNGQGVRGVRGFGQLGEAEHARDHGGDLLLVRRAVARDGGLHFTRRVQGDGEPALRCGVQRDTAHLICLPVRQ